MSQKTPLVTSQTTNDITGKTVYFKMENQQKTGAFKFRGASFKLKRLTDEELNRGVVTASAGNHAQGVALAAYKLGVKATIYMPVNTPIQKVRATESYGATVVLIGESFDDAYHASLEFQKETGATYVHPFDDVHVIAGQGTIAREMIEEIKNLECIIVPIGGGGLASGIAYTAKSINPNIRIIGVQAYGAKAMYESFHQNKHVVLEKVDTIADGIAVKEPGKITEQTCKNYVDDIVTVTDGEIANAMIYMLERNKTLVEGAGASPLAYLLYHHKDIKEQNIGLVISGGNVDISRFGEFHKLANEYTSY